MPWMGRWLQTFSFVTSRYIILGHYSDLSNEVPLMWPTPCQGHSQDTISVQHTPFSTTRVCCFYAVSSAWIQSWCFGFVARLQSVFQCGERNLNHGDVFCQLQAIAPYAVVCTSLCNTCSYLRWRCASNMALCPCFGLKCISTLSRIFQLSKRVLANSAEPVFDLKTLTLDSRLLQKTSTIALVKCIWIFTGW